MLTRLLVTGSAVIVMAGCHGDGMMSMSPTGMMNTRAVFATNGETIFRTGRNQEGIVMQDLSRSEMPMAHACVSCHGPNGEGMSMSMMGRSAPSIRFRDLSDPAQHRVPYTEALVKRFLDQEIKSDGTAARTGVAWKMSEQDKDDLIAFLKTL